MARMPAGGVSRRRSGPLAVLAVAAALVLSGSPATGHDVKDLKYGAVLFEFYQQKYFETLVEFAYAEERGGIREHGDYPELLRGGVSLSYGLDRQAKDIFSRLISDNAAGDVQNRAWFYLAKMLYLRGEPERAAQTLSRVEGRMPDDIDQEYRYLAALVNIKLGLFEEAETLSVDVDRRGRYAPYLLFNLGVARGKQSQYERAVQNLERAASYAKAGGELSPLADRAHLAIAYLLAEAGNPAAAYEHIDRVSTSGVFSNRALLGSGWASINSGDYRRALGPLTVLAGRSIAVPEVQEATLVVAHVYEKLGLIGRAAEGFIEAYDRYTGALEQLDQARTTLQDADVLELFVRNLDDVLGESDWFGTAPAVSVNDLSPFLLELMSDHSFQAVLKDLRDLYAIRNNLERWRRRRGDFEVIIRSWSDSPGREDRAREIVLASERHAGLRDRHESIRGRLAALPAEERALLTWMVDDIGFRMASAHDMVNALRQGPEPRAGVEEYAALVETNMTEVEEQLARTNALIEKVERVLLELVDAELELHEKRIKYYRVQSHLAKARILDRSLAVLDDTETGAATSDPVEGGAGSPGEGPAAPREGADHEP